MAQENSKRLAGKIALVTGANTGIGRVIAVELAKQGAHVFVACRSAERAQAVLDEIRAQPDGGKAELLPLDLGDFASIRQCANTFLARGLPLHLLINNAGLAGARGHTRDGFELAFGVNHLGHFLLTQLLLDRIKASAPARIVTVASKAHYRAPGIDWQAVRAADAHSNGLAGVRGLQAGKCPVQRGAWPQARGQRRHDLLPASGRRRHRGLAQRALAVRLADEARADFPGKGSADHVCTARRRRA